MECNNSSADEQPTKVGIKARATAKIAAYTSKLNLKELPDDKRYWVVKPEKKKKERKDVEHNGFELIFALCCLFPTIETMGHVKEKTFQDCTNNGLEVRENDFDKYKKDVETRNDAEVQNYIKNFRLNYPIKGKVKNVYLEGKNLRTPKLQNLNKGINRKKAKADVYVECVKKCSFNGKTMLLSKMYGFSVKQNKCCTKTNYSVEKILAELCGEEEGKNLIKEMTTLRRNILKNVGIDEKNYKQHRGRGGKTNTTFYDSLEGTNPYWNSMRESLEKNLNTVAQVLAKYMFPTELRYPLYEFDGSKFEKLNVSASSIVNFIEHTPYYFDKKGERRAAAKMFYKLVINEKTYRVEIRFKGDNWNGSPQFQIHNDSN
jgi:hypothetical protein